MLTRYKQSQLKTLWARYRYFLSLLKVRLLRRMDPVIAVLIVNNKCNFDCKYCYGNYAHRTVRDYTTEEVKNIIDELYEMGVRYLNVHGGETLLRKDIGEIVDYIKNKGIYCCIITNGTLLPQKIDEIRNVDNLTISLDGTKENNDINRGKGSYDIALNAIKLAIKEKIPLRVSATITKYTMNDIGYLANLAKELGFSLYFSILFKPLPKAKEFEMTNEEIKNAINQVIEYKKRGFPIFTSYQVAEYARDWPLVHNKYHFLRKKDVFLLPKDFRPIKCYFGKNKIVVEADGNVYPCTVLGEKEFKPMNLREVGLKRAIRHVQETNDCVACPAMACNDHNLLMDLDIVQIGHVILDQIKETIRRKKN